jgi:thiol-disulfide isomerase/thioredoxin
MKTINLFLTLLLITSCSSQKPIVNNKGNLVGISQKSDFQSGNFKTWFDDEYNGYTADTKTLESIKINLNNITIKAFMGTWCGDSRREVPRFYKILNALDFKTKNFKMIALDRSKQTPDNLQEGFNINYVPTFIFYKNNKEIGRIVESPIETLEADFLTIITRKPYTPNYAE